MEQEIENIVCNYFGITIEEFYSKRNFSNISDARHFVCYILHCRYGYSFAYLARRYSISKRNMQKRVAKIKNGVATQPFYRNKLSDIEGIIKETLE